MITTAHYIPQKERKAYNLAFLFLSRFNRLPLSKKIDSINNRILYSGSHSKYKVEYCIEIGTLTFCKGQNKATYHLDNISQETVLSLTV